MRATRLSIALMVSFLPVPKLAAEHLNKIVFETTKHGFVCHPCGAELTANAPGLTLLLASGQARMSLAGASPDAAVTGEDQAGRAHYLIGNDPGAWRRDVKQYRRVRYRNVYPGIDLVFHGKSGVLEYDFEVSAGADPRQISLVFDGAGGISLTQAGDLEWRVEDETVRQRKPAIFIKSNGSTREIAGAFEIDGKAVRFQLAEEYPRDADLVIDPVIEYSTYVGESGYDAGVAVATDAAGASYITGVTNSQRLPTTASSAQRSPGGASDVFVAKIAATGELAWITYLGGKGTENGLRLALDGGGNVYVSGFTDSADFPQVNAAAKGFGGMLDAFVAKINPSGTALLYSTYVGGTQDDYGNGLAVDRQGNAYLTGWTTSPDFPVKGGFQQGPAGGGGDTFVTKIAAAGDSFVYSTFVGGNGQDLATGLAVDAEGNAYVTGSTTSTVFPTQIPLQSKLAGKEDAFIYKLNAAGNSLIYSTYLGGPEGDLGYRVAVDGAGSAYVSGYSRSAPFPIRNGFGKSLRGPSDVVIAKLTPGGEALAWSTFLGGSAEDYGLGNLVVDEAGSVYVTGWTNSTDFPVLNAMQTAYGGGRADAFITRIAPSGDALVYSSYAGGREEDKGYGLALGVNGAVTMTGHTTSADFPKALNGATQGLSTADIFVARVSPDSAASFFTASPASLRFSSDSGAQPAPLQVRVGMTAAPLSWTTSADVPWLKVSPPSGAGTGTIQISAEGAPMPPGTHTGNVTIAPNTGGPSLRVPVTLTIAAPVLAIATNGVVNGASFQQGVIAPGQMIVVFGTGFGTPALISGELTTEGLPTRIGDVRLLIDEIPAPLLYVRSGQLCAFVPYGISGGVVNLQLETSGRRSAPAAAMTRKVNPALFSANSSGGGQAAAQNQDGRTNGPDNPAVRGSVMVFYGTGEGLLLPGTAKPVSQTGIAFSGIPAELLYAGSIPGSAPGVVQFNVRVPQELEPGTAIPVTFTATADGAIYISPPVTVAIR